jgi:hypothetical protein
MIIAEVIAVAFVLFSSIALFVHLHREHKRNLPRQEGEEC